MRKNVWTLGLFAIVTGCSASSGTADGSGAGASEGQVFQETVIRVGPDGASHIFTRPITVEQELADNEARRASRAAGVTSPTPSESKVHVEATIDAACAGSDMWLYDALNGTGNRICVSGTGFQDLAKIVFACRAVGKVALCEFASARVRSFYPGVEWGYLEQEGSYCSQSFGSWGPLTNADACGVTANSLALAPII